MRARVAQLGPAFAGEPARVQVFFEREVPEAAFGLTVREYKDFWGRGRDKVLRKTYPHAPLRMEASLAVLEGRGDVLAQRFFAQRGQHPLHDFELITTFPFSLLEKGRDLPAATEIVVRPRRVPAPAELADPRGFVPEGDEAPDRGAGLEIYGLREREDRDALSRLHALRSLTLDRDVVLETAGVIRPTTWIGIANQRGASPLAFEHTLALAQAIIGAWSDAGWAVGVATLGWTARPSGTDIEATLDKLATLDLVAGSADGVAALWLVPQGASTDVKGRAVHVAPDGAWSLA